MEAGGRYLGRRQRRLDGSQLLFGRARFVDDIHVPAALHLEFLRSPVASGSLRTVDVSTASRAPGVRHCMTGQDDRAPAGPIPPFIDPRARGAAYAPARCLALDRVTYVGEPIAAVVAGTRREAQAALALVRLEIDPTASLLDVDDALASDAKPIYPQWTDNVLLQRSYGFGRSSTEIDRATFVVDGELAFARSTSSPIEPRACIADWDDVEGRLTVWSTCQNPHALRWMISESLSLPESSVRVIVPRLGGSFGLKMAGHPEDIVVALMARLSRRAVRWVEDRPQSLMHGAREQRHRYRAGFEPDGRIVGFQDDIVADSGAVSAQAGWGMPNLTGLTLPSGYDIQACDVELRAVVTNKPPIAAARGFGKDTATIVMERVVDQVAARLALDPSEVRRRNFVPAGSFPYRTSSGLNIDSGDYASLLDKALLAAGERDIRRRQAELRTVGRYLGLGIAFELTPESADGPGTQVSGFDTTTVRIEPDGSVTALTGVTSPGGGNDTGIAQIVADELGVEIDRVQVVQGDTDRTPYGFGNFSGRGLLTGGGAAALAARDLRSRIEAAAASMFGVAPEAVTSRAGRVMIDGDDGQSLRIAEVVTAMATRAFQAVGDVEPLLQATRSYRPGNIDHVPDSEGRLQPYPTYSSGVYVAALEVDPATGVVQLEHIVIAHDCGTMINPALVEAQIHGAVAFGIGIALTEELHFEQGRLVTDRLKTYRLPRAADVPPITIVHQETPSPFTLFGNKGAGEAGVGGTAAAITNGVADALGPLGFTLTRLPLTPPAILAAMADRAS